MTHKINPWLVGLTLGALLGLWHALWCVLVATGVAQSVLDFIFQLHMLKPVYVVQEFNAATAGILVGVTFGVGFVMGTVFGFIWNLLHSKNPA
jgi:hypothetical protein